MQKTFYQENAKIVYRIEGEGMPVILVHGFGEDCNVWNEQINFLKDHCRLITPDLPGSGQSKFIEKALLSSNSQPSTIEYYADCIHALLRHLNIAQCILL